VSNILDIQLFLADGVWDEEQLIWQTFVSQYQDVRIVVRFNLAFLVGSCDGMAVILILVSWLRSVKNVIAGAILDIVGYVACLGL
jgi:hypothetical protein